MPLVGFATHPLMVEHDTGPHHPERPDRLRAIARGLRQAGLLTSPDPFPDFRIDLGPLAQARQSLVELRPVPADEAIIELVHPRKYIDHVRRVCDVGGVLDQGDTRVMRASYRAALMSLGCAIRCCDAVMRGQVQRAFSAGRPPGHHAEPDRGMGFCLFSNAAIAARYLQRHHGLQRIAIIDFDVHHGNGTQACFEHDPNVFFASLHQDPRTCYPGSGLSWEIGLAEGRGLTLNLPMQPGSEDAEYLRVVDTIVVPELEEFRPEALLISAGFDAHAEDPLADIQLSEEGYDLMTRSLVAVADRYCSGRVISILEGGYNLRVLARSLVRHLLALQA